MGAGIAAYPGSGRTGISLRRQSARWSVPMFFACGRGNLDITACRIAFVWHLPEQAAGRASAGDENLDLVDERARLAKEQADAQFMKNDLMRGEVVPVADVLKLVAGEYAAVRIQLLAIPAAQAPRVHRCRSPAEVQDVLMGAVVHALEHLASDALREPAKR